MAALLQPEDKVLSTLNADGTRRRLRPRAWKGRFFRWRRVMAYSLIALFTAIPYIPFKGKPLILLDLPRREFTFFGSTFLPTDTVLLMLLLVAIVLAIFMLTALFGRVWCGWACPQTVYMEFIYRPLERLFEGRAKEKASVPRSLGKNVAFLLVSMFLAHIFLAYFVGVEQLFAWVRQSPFDHPTAFLVMAGTAVAMFIDFAWFREQTCIVACPYGRLQSVLLDRQSLIVGYDYDRGEPRGKVKAKTTADGKPLGDCIQCSACVSVCPTGIDIREGLQMECIGCTQCIDACDSMMDRVGRPRGLIRYTSEDRLEHKGTKLLRARVVVYPALLVLVLGLFGYALAHREAADVTVLRGIGSPFALLAGGQVSNQLRVKVVNRTPAARRYRIELLDAPGAKMVAPQNPLPVAAGQAQTTSVFVLAPRGSFSAGIKIVRIRISDGQGFERTVTYRLLGPTGLPGGGA